MSRSKDREFKEFPGKIFSLQLSLSAYLQVSLPDHHTWSLRASQIDEIHDGSLDGTVFFVADILTLHDKSEDGVGTRTTRVHRRLAEMTPTLSFLSSFRGEGKRDEIDSGRRKKEENEETEKGKTKQREKERQK